MCVITLLPRIAGFDWLLLANRDEYHARPTQPMGLCLDGRAIAGLDLQSGGTWLAFDTQRPRMAAITNIRRAVTPRGQLRSRGELPLEFIGGALSIDAFVASLSARASHFLPFNLLLFDRGRICCWSSTTCERLDADDKGLVVGNAEAGVDWPKTSRLRDLAAALPSRPDADDLFRVLDDRWVPPDRLLPDTGIGLARERFLSPIRILGDTYGTRCSTVFTWSGAWAHGIERSWDPDGALQGERAFTLAWPCG